MLQALIMNGFVALIMSVVRLIRKLYYKLKGAVTVEAFVEEPSVIKEGFMTVVRTHEGEPYSITLAKMMEREPNFDRYEKGESIDIYWIPGKKRAMIPKSQAVRKKQAVNDAALKAQLTSQGKFR